MLEETLTLSLHFYGQYITDNAIYYYFYSGLFSPLLLSVFHLGVYIILLLSYFHTTELSTRTLRFPFHISYIISFWSSCMNNFLQYPDVLLTFELDDDDDKIRKLTSLSQSLTFPKYNIAKAARVHPYNYMCTHRTAITAITFH